MPGGVNARITAGGTSSVLGRLDASAPGRGGPRFRRRLTFQFPPRRAFASVAAWTLSKPAHPTRGAETTLAAGRGALPRALLSAHRSAASRSGRRDLPGNRTVQPRRARGRWLGRRRLVRAGQLRRARLSGRRFAPPKCRRALFVTWTTAFLGLTLAVKSNVFFGTVTYARASAPKSSASCPGNCRSLARLGAQQPRDRPAPARPGGVIGITATGLVCVAALLVLWTSLAMEPFLSMWPLVAVRRRELDAKLLGVPWVASPSSFVLAL